MDALLQKLDKIERGLKADQMMQSERLEKLAHSIDQKLQADAAIAEARYHEIKSTIKAMEVKLLAQAKFDSASNPAARPPSSLGTRPGTAGVGSALGGGKAAKRQGVRNQSVGDWSSSPVGNLSSILELPPDEESAYSAYQSPIRKITTAQSQSRPSFIVESDSPSKAIKVPLLLLTAFKYIPSDEQRHDFLLKAFTLLKFIFYDVWDPVTPARRWWDSFIIVLMFYILVVTPYAVAFEIDPTNRSSPVGVLNIIISTFFLTDILLNFKTSYASSKNFFIRSRLKIALHYLSFWFWIDLVGSLPWAFMLDNAAPVQVLRLLVLLRLFRVVSTLRLMKEINRHSTSDMFEWIEYRMGKTNFALTRLTLVTLLILHWTACTFYYASSWNNFSSDTWVYKKLLVAQAGNDYKDAPYWKRYIYAFYWATDTLANVGYGDVIAVSIYEKLVAIFFVLTGALLFAFITGFFIAMITEGDPARMHILRKLSYVENFIQKRKVPAYLAKKIRRFFNFTVRREYMDDEAAVINDLPERLQMQVILDLNDEFITSIPMFIGKSTSFIFAVVKRLKLDFALPGDAVAWQGDLLHEVYFLAEGIIEVRLYSQATTQLRGVMASKTLDQASKATKGEDKDEYDSLFEGIDKAKDKALVALGKMGWKGAESRRSIVKVAPLESLVELTKSQPDDLTASRSTLLGTLIAGNSFGGTSSLQKVPLPATAVAKTDCELHCLTVADVDEVASEFPELLTEIRSLGYICCLTEVVQAAIEAAREQAERAVSGKASDREEPAERPASRQPLFGGWGLIMSSD